MPKKRLKQAFAFGLFAVFIGIECFGLFSLDAISPAALYGFEILFIGLALPSPSCFWLCLFLPTFLQDTSPSLQIFQPYLFHECFSLESLFFTSCSDHKTFPISSKSTLESFFSFALMSSSTVCSCRPPPVWSPWFPQSFFALWLATYFILISALFCVHFGFTLQLLHSLFSLSLFFLLTPISPF